MMNELDRWVKDLMKELGEEIALELQAEVDDNIARGFKKRELNWKPLSEKYRKRKEKEGRNLKGLIYHGHLLRATDTNVEYKKGKLIVKVGNNMEYAPYHEFGTKKMPARPFIKPALEKIQKDLPKIVEKVFKRMR